MNSHSEDYHILDKFLTEMEPVNQFHPGAYGAGKPAYHCLLIILSRKWNIWVGSILLYYWVRGGLLTSTASFRNTGTHSMLKEVQITLLLTKKPIPDLLSSAKKSKDQEGNQLLLFLHNTVHTLKIYNPNKIRTLQGHNHAKVAANTQYWQTLRWDGTMLDPKSLSWLSFLRWK